MTVYILFYQDCWEDSKDSIGIFSTKEKAEEAKLALMIAWPDLYSINSDYWSIDSWIVDNPDIP